MFATATPATKSKDAAYERKKLREAARQRTIAASGREIGDIPAPVNPARKAATAKNFKLFCETYFRDVFALEWSADHLEVIDAIETTILKGGLFALAMPRGSGKTSLCEVACVWAALFGHHRFILLIGADNDAASESLLTVRTYLETNDLLAEDFPEVCYPLAKLEGIQQRRLLYRGKPLKMKFTQHSVILPDIPASQAANVIFRVTGITGRIRGMKYTRPDKTAVRPSLCLIDDPQTDKSAESVAMCASRERIIAKAVQGLAGPGKQIAALMPCTVIRRDDMADRLLSRDRHPAWHGRRFKLVYNWPTRMDLWEQYVQIRHDCQRMDKSTAPATTFYKKHRAEMDAGAIVQWEARRLPDEISAIQNCINLRFENKENAEAAFLCEYQNEPPELDEGANKLPSLDEIQDHAGPYHRRAVPPEVSNVVASIDVQGDLLYWDVWGSTPNFSTYLLDYGTWPEQPTTHFTLKSAPNTLSAKYPTAHADGRLYNGLTDLIAYLSSLSLTSSPRPGTPGRGVGGEGPGATSHVLRIEKIGIDASFKTSLIHRFCRESPHSTNLIPTHGKGISVKQLPMRKYKVGPGERLGEFWMLTNGNAKARTTRHLVIDTNTVKTFIFERLATTIGDPGSMQFHAKHPTRHRMRAEHLLSEYRTHVSTDDRSIDEWTQRPGRPDNHYLDTTGIAMALLHFTGCRLEIAGATPKPKKPRRTREAEYL